MKMREGLMSGLPDNRDSKHIFKVSEITRQLKRLIEEAMPYVWIEGEVSNLRMPSSGHMYFTLKDSASQIQAVFFNYSDRITFPLKDGLKVSVPYKLLLMN
jgi:exodeoxyribonuclease VII large subunit